MPRRWKLVPRGLRSATQLFDRHAVGQHVHAASRVRHEPSSARRWPPRAAGRRRGGQQSGRRRATHCGRVVQARPVGGRRYGPRPGGGLLLSHVPADAHRVSGRRRWPWALESFRRQHALHRRRLLVPRMQDDAGLRPLHQPAGQGRRVCLARGQDLRLRHALLPPRARSLPRLLRRQRDDLSAGRDDHDRQDGAFAPRARNGEARARPGELQRPVARVRGAPLRRPGR